MYDDVTDTIPRLLLPSGDITRQNVTTQELGILRDLLSKSPADARLIEVLPAVTPISAPPAPTEEIELDTIVSQPQSFEPDAAMWDRWAASSHSASLPKRGKLTAERPEKAPSRRRGKRRRRDPLARAKAFYATVAASNLAFGLAVNLIPNDQHIAQVIGLAALAVGGACVTAFIELTKH